jgi:HPt (histidine-containing phosphotransfer) domain-containing protein
MSDLPVLDRAALERLKEWGGDSLPGKMIDIFLGHAPERMAQIREGVASGAARTAEAGAHSLKSSAGNVGALRLQGLLEEMERLAEQGRIAELAGLLPGLESAFGAACQELRIVWEEVEG